MCFLLWNIVINGVTSRETCVFVNSWWEYEDRFSTFFVWSVEKEIKSFSNLKAVWKEERDKSTSTDLKLIYCDIV